MMPVLPVI